MRVTAKTKIFSVIGNPVKHSKSPIIHNFVFEKMNFDGIYVAFEVKDLQTFFKFVKDVDIAGLSITIPHKVDSIKYIDELDRFASKAEAINTVKNENGKLTGYNTDVTGILKSFEIKGIKSLDNKIALVLGSGGVSRAVILALIEMNIKNITICARNREKALEVKNKFSQFANIDFSPWESRFELAKLSDIIVNCTPLGMTPDIDSSPLDENSISPEHIVFDTVYTPIETKLIKVSNSIGAKVVYGIDMFVFQALEQDRIWIGTENVFNLKDDIKNLLMLSN